MPATAFSPDEDQRLEALHSYQILDTPAESAFDDLTLLAAKVCATPISLVSLIDRDRQWFKSKLGLGANETHRDFAFCAHTILQPGIFVVPDAQQDKRFRNNPLVKNDPYVRFYAATPLINPEGYCLGTLCVIDRVPRQLDAHQLEMLAAIGRQVTTHLELRRTVVTLGQEVRQRQEIEETLKQTEVEFRSIFENAVEGIYQTTIDGRYFRANPMLAKIYGYDSPAELIASITDIQHQLYVDENQRLEFRRLMQLHDHLSGFESQVYCKDDRIIWISENARSIRSPTGELLGYEGSVMDITDRKRTEQRLETQHTLTRLLAEFKNLEEAIPQLLQILCSDLEWDAGEFWQCDSSTEQLRCVQNWHRTSLSLAEFEAVTRQRIGIKGQGITGQIWQSEEPIWLADALQAQNFLRADLAAAAGLRTVFGFPILHNEQVVGVLMLFSCQVQPVDQSLVRMLTAIGRQVGQFVKRKEAEAELRESKERFRSAFDNAAIGMALVSLEGRWLQVNPSLCELVGYSETELLDSTFQDITHPDDFGISTERVLEFLAGANRFYQGEKRYVHKQGQILWVMLNVSLVRDCDGSPLYFVSQIKDITSSKQAEAALQASEYRFRTLSRFAPVGIFLADETGSCTYVNDRWCNLMGLPAEAALGKGWSQVLHPLDCDRVLTAWNRTVQTSSEFIQELRALTTDGRVNWVIVRATPLRDSQDRVTGFIGTASDITSLKQAEQEMQENEAAIRALYDITAAQSVSFEERFEQLLRLGCRQFGLQFGFLGQVKGHRYEVVNVQSPDRSIPVGTVFDLRQTYCREGLKAADPV